MELFTASVMSVFPWLTIEPSQNLIKKTDFTSTHNRSVAGSSPARGTTSHSDTIHAPLIASSLKTYSNKIDMIKVAI